MAGREIKSVRDISNAVAQQMGESIAKAALSGVAGKLSEGVSTGVFRDYRDLNVGAIDPFKGMDVKSIFGVVAEMNTVLGRDFGLKVDDPSMLQRAKATIARVPEPVTYSLAPVRNPMPGLTREHIAATNRLNETIMARARLAKAENLKSQRTSTIVAILSIVIAIGSLAVAIIK